MLIRKWLLIQQSLFRSLHLMKMEAVHDLLHQSLDFLITQITDTAFMRMTNLFVVTEETGLDVQTNFFISITERYSLTNQTVDLFYTKDKQVFIIVKNMFVYFHLTHNKSSHLQAIFQLLKRRKKDLFYNLQITEIT